MPDRTRADFPLVRGVTQTAANSTSLEDRLSEALSKRPGASTEFIDEAIDNLERAFAVEEREELRARIAATIVMLRDGPRKSVTS